MNLSLDKHTVTFELGPTAPLTWLSFGIETAALWYFGRGVWRLLLWRLPHGTEGLRVCVGPLDGAKVGPLRFSGFTTFEILAQHNQFPARLVELWNPLDGQARNETMVESVGLKTDTLMSQLAYGLADLVTDLFKRGATTVKCQYSFAKCQVLGNVGLDRRELASFANPQVCDYTVQDHVAQLPWPKA